MEKNAGEWTEKVEITKEEISGSKRSMHDNILTYPRLFSGESLSSVFSSDGTLNSASAAPHCGVSCSVISIVTLTRDRNSAKNVDTSPQFSIVP